MKGSPEGNTGEWTAANEVRVWLFAKTDSQDCSIVILPAEALARQKSSDIPILPSDRLRRGIQMSRERRLSRNPTWPQCSSYRGCRRPGLAICTEVEACCPSGFSAS